MLFRLSLRFLKGSPGLTLLNIITIAIGISVPIAIELANHSVLSAFRSTLDVVTGKANLEITGNGTRFDEQAFRTVKLTDGITAASPSVEGVVSIPDFPDEYLRILGIDIFSYRPFATFDFSKSQEHSIRNEWITDPESIAISASLAKKLKLKPGDRLKILVRGQERGLVIQDVFDFDQDHLTADEHLAIMDIAAAQTLLGALGKLNRIELLTPQDPEKLAATIQPHLPLDATIRLPERRGTQISNMLGAFQLNLFALSLIAIIVAVFLFHTSLTTLVLRQRHWMGTLRTLGFLPREIRWLMFFQAGFISCIGMSIGTCLGFLLAKESLQTMSQAVSSIYLLVHARNLSWDFELLAKIWAFGFLAVALATWLPARESSRIKPTLAFRMEQSGFQLRRSRLAWISVLFLVGVILTSYGALNTSWR